MTPALVLLVVGEVVAIVWLAALLLLLRDRWVGHRPEGLSEPAPSPSPERETGDAAGPLSPTLPWLRILRVPLAILIAPPVVIVLLILFLPLLALQLGWLAYHQARYRLLGIPLPVVEIPDDIDSP